jgi:hypothetical protein
LGLDTTNEMAVARLVERRTHLALEANASESQRAHLEGTRVCKLTGKSIKIEWRACVLVGRGSVCGVQSDHATSTADVAGTRFPRLRHTRRFPTRSCVLEL